MIEDYWLKLARTYYMLVKRTNRTCHAILGREAAKKAIEEDKLLLFPDTTVRVLPPIPTKTMVWDRRKFLRY